VVLLSGDLGAVKQVAVPAGGGVQGRGEAAAQVGGGPESGAAGDGGQGVVGGLKELLSGEDAFALDPPAFRS